MEIKFYSDIEVHLLRATENPMAMLKIAADLPMSIDVDIDALIELSDEDIEDTMIDRISRIVSMDHTTVIEFVDFTFLIKGISGALLRQIRTHRIASWMSTSQHYKDAISFGYTFNKMPPQKVLDAIAILEEAYAEQVAIIGKEEARMWLPVATSYNILFKANARSLMRFFLTRLCRRNVLEMYIMALKIYAVAKEHIPELISLMGPSCIVNGKCNQGKMCCGKPLTKESLQKEIEKYEPN
jgi:thymidylate synthase (FAD)